MVGPKPHEPTASLQCSVATTPFTQEIVFASLLLRIVTTSGFPEVSLHVHSFHELWRALVCVSQARCTWQVASLRRVDQGQEQSNPLPFVLQAWEQPGLRFCTESGNCSEDKKTFLRRIARQICTREHFSWAAADDNRQRKKITRGTTRLGSREWRRLLRRRRLRITRQSIVWSRLGVTDGETAAKKKFLSSLSWRQGMASALVKLNVQHHAQMSKLHERETAREIQNDSWMHHSRCACVSVWCANKQQFQATGRHSFILLVLKSVCGSHHSAAKKKKTGNQFPDWLFLGCR